MKTELKKIIDKEVYWGTLNRALISLLPIFLCYILTHQTIFFNIGLIIISLAVGIERLNLGLKIVCLHFLVILACFTVLYFTFTIPYLFIFTTAFLAFLTIYVTKFGSNIRTLANYTFIPTVYLTCELHKKTLSLGIISTYSHFILLTPIAFVCIILTYGVWHRFKITPQINCGKPEKNWLFPAIAMFVGVLVAASIVKFQHISRGEWVIWSVASIINFEISKTKEKFKDRMWGAIAGAPVGALMAQILPKNEFVYALSALGIILTLVSFKRYRLAFACRCSFISLTAFMTSSTSIIALDRITNVLMGGIIGLIAVYITQEALSFKKYSKRWTNPV